VILYCVVIYISVPKQGISLKRLLDSVFHKTTDMAKCVDRQRDRWE